MGNNADKKHEMTKDNGIQVTYKHRERLPPHQGHACGLRMLLHIGYGLRPLGRVPLRRKAARENLRARRRQVAHARTVARPLAEPSRRGARTRKAFPLADKSAYHYYADFAEKGYYNRVISGNVNQTVRVDSVVCDFSRHPYKTVTYARLIIIRQSNVTERSLVTSCSLRNTGRSDGNPNGFIIEHLAILENKDIMTTER